MPDPSDTSNSASSADSSDASETCDASESTAKSEIAHAESPSASLEQALVAAQLTLPAEQVELLDHYRASLWRWNEQLNLTRHTTFDKFVQRDVVDSLQIAQLVPPDLRVLDVGSGGGTPGLILAICRPDLRVALCEATQKKARVLQAMVDELGLSVDVFGCRVEELLPMRPFDVLLARAVAPIAKMLGWLQPHWDSFEELLLIKGRQWPEERKEARHRGLLRSIELRCASTYAMPGTGGESVILRFRRKPTNEDEESPSEG